MTDPAHTLADAAAEAIAELATLDERRQVLVNVIREAQAVLKRIKLPRTRQPKAPKPSKRSKARPAATVRRPTAAAEFTEPDSRE